MTSVRLGLAGVGRMGSFHAQTITGGCALARLGCVYDASEELARAASERFGVPWVATYDELLAHPEVDAVAVATPTGTHADLTIAAARAGRDVLCEKPISLDRAATVLTLKEVAQAGVLLQVGLHRRYDPDWVAVAERIRAGELGKVTLLRSSLRDPSSPPPSFLGASGGIFRDMMIHDLDVARWLVGEVVEVTGHATTVSDPAGFAAIGDADTGVIVLRFADGGLAVLDSTRVAGYGYEASTEVMGAAATVRVDAPYRANYEWRTPGRATRELAETMVERFPRAYAAQFDAFARCVLDRSTPRATGADALAAFDLAEAADRSWRSGRPVPVHRTDDGGYAAS
jgi:predicted dehydrogenase